IFSSMDLVSAFHQIRVKEDSIPLTSFVCPFGLFEFIVTPFGLTNGPLTCQRLMASILKDFIGVFLFVYLDDIIVFSPDLQTHLQHLESVFKAFKENAIYVKLGK